MRPSLRFVGCSNVAVVRSHPPSLFRHNLSLDGENVPPYPRPPEGLLRLSPSSSRL